MNEIPPSENKDPSPTGVSNNWLAKTLAEIGKYEDETLQKITTRGEALARVITSTVFGIGIGGGIIGAGWTFLALQEGAYVTAALTAGLGTTIAAFYGVDVVKAVDRATEVWNKSEEDR